MAIADSPGFVEPNKTKNQGQFNGRQRVHEGTDCMSGKLERVRVRRYFSVTEMNDMAT
jgi:hypothetical protein